ncbi:MAG: hypothetical protein WBZ24_11100 [Anaerolineales bacterium]|jgi:hypothetical protein
MLESMLEADRKAIKDDSERAEQADATGDIRLKDALNDMVGDVTNHYKEMMQILEKWEFRPACVDTRSCRLQPQSFSWLLPSSFTA